MVPNLWLLNMWDPHFADRSIKDHERDFVFVWYFLWYIVLQPYRLFSNCNIICSFPLPQDRDEFWKQNFCSRASLGYFMKYTSHFSFHTSLFQLPKKKIIQPSNAYQTFLGRQRDPIPTPKPMKEVDSPCTLLLRNISLAQWWFYEFGNIK